MRWRPSRQNWIVGSVGALAGCLGMMWNHGGMVVPLSMMTAPFAIVADMLLVVLLDPVMTAAHVPSAGWFVLVSLFGCVINGMAWAAIVQLIAWARVRHWVLFFALLFVIGGYWLTILWTWLVAPAKL